MSEVKFIGKIELYQDEECKEPLKSLTLPDVVNVGEQKSIDVYLVNRSEHKFEISKVEKEDSDVTFEFEKKTLVKDKPVKMTVTFAPKLDRVTVLDASFKLKGRFIIQALAY